MIVKKIRVVKNQNLMEQFSSKSPVEESASLLFDLKKNNKDFAISSTECEV